MCWRYLCCFGVHYTLLPYLAHVMTAFTAKAYILFDATGEIVCEAIDFFVKFNCLSLMDEIVVFIEVYHCGMKHPRLDQKHYMLAVS